MKKTRFTEEQIIRVLKELDGGKPIKDVCRKHGVRDGAIYNWKAKFGGMDISDALRLISISRSTIQYEARPDQNG